MVKKKKSAKKPARKSVRKGKSDGFDLGKDFKQFKKGVKIEAHEIEKNIKKDVKELEDWMKARRKFLIKLAWVIGIVAILLIVSHFLLRVWGTGV